MPRDLRAEEERAASALRDAVMSIEWPRAVPTIPKDHSGETFDNIVGGSGLDLDAGIAQWREDVNKCLQGSTREWIFWRAEPVIEVHIGPKSGRIIWDIHSRFRLPASNAS